MGKNVTEVHVYPGDDIRKIIPIALDNAPSFFNFNGLKIEVSEDMRTHPDAFVYLYDYYHCWLGEEPLPKWPPKGKAVEHAQQNVNVTASWTVSAGPIEVFIYLIRLHILMQKRPES